MLGLGLLLILLVISLTYEKYRSDREVARLLAIAEELENEDCTCPDGWHGGGAPDCG
jgi:hypothetical protein